MCTTTSLTLSFLSREKNKVILQGGAVIGKCQFQTELIEVAHAGNRWVRHVGRVAERIETTKSGSSNSDICGERIINESFFLSYILLFIRGQSQIFTV